MKTYFSMCAAYNHWANERVYDAVADMPDEDYRRDCGAFFRSLHGTLNHLLAADRIWMRRFTGEGDAPSTLDAILHESLDALRAARRAEDDRIIRYVAGLAEDDLSSVIRYRTITQPQDVVQPLAAALAHVFNHQTHHRGQAHALLTRLKGAAPSLDMILFQRQNPAQAFSGRP